MEFCLPFFRFLFVKWFHHIYRMYNLYVCASSVRQKKEQQFDTIKMEERSTTIWDTLNSQATGQGSFDKQGTSS